MPNSQRTLRWRNQAFLGAAIVIGILSSKFLYGFIKASLQEGYSSQTVLVPFISIYLIWQERKRIFAAPDYSLMHGVTLAVAGVLGFVAADPMWSHSLAGLNATKLLSVILMIAGAFIACYGMRAFKASAFPFCFLVLMLPLPPAIIDKIVVFLQSQSTALSYHLFSWLGVPVFRNGFLLTVPGVTIEVAKECSGINSSVALLITALLVAHNTLRTNLCRITLILLTIPLSIVKNGVRIVTLTLLALKVDPSFLTGHLHHDGGFVFFLISLGLLYPLWMLLRKSEGSPPAKPLPSTPFTAETLLH